MEDIFFRLLLFAFFAKNMVHDLVYTGKME